MTENRTSIFERQPFVVLFALTAAIVWGWAYPLIKLGFAEFGIEQTMTGSKMLFAGIRFFVSGLIVLGIAKGTNRSFSAQWDRDWWYILIFTLVNTTLHYTFFYIGLSYCQGARSAILNSLSGFLVVILACFLFKSDRFTGRKALGCLLGFAGILLLNAGGASSGSFTLMGDGMIILNAVCGAIASLMTRGLGQRIDIFAGTGISLSAGGLLLMIPGLMLGGTLPHYTLVGIIYLLLLIGISTIGFTLYNKLISCNPVGKVAIFNSLIPVVGAVTSCLCLNEPFYWKYLFAGAFATVGIYLINSKKN